MIPKECECSGVIMWKEWPDKVSTGTCALCKKKWYTTGDTVYNGSIKRPAMKSDIESGIAKSKEITKQISACVHMDIVPWPRIGELQSEYGDCMRKTGLYIHEERERLRSQKKELEEEMELLGNCDAWADALMEHVSIMIQYEELGGLYYDSL